MPFEEVESLIGGPFGIPGMQELREPCVDKRGDRPILLPVEGVEPAAVLVGLCEGGAGYAAGHRPPRAWYLLGTAPTAASSSQKSAGVISSESGRANHVAMALWVRESW